MKYDVFMRTCTHDGDYDWVNRPDYMPENLHEAFGSVLALCENPAFDELSWDDWGSNFFYARTDRCCFLARIVKTKYIGSNNQSIISFEGISVKAQNENYLFYNIPSLINDLLPPAKSFRATFEEEGFVSEVFEADPLLNPFDGYRIPAEVHPAVMNNAAYRNLLKFTAFTEKPTGFIFGKNAKAFSDYLDIDKLGMSYVFDFQNPDSPDVNENAFYDNYTPLVCEYKKPVPTGSDKVTICLFVQETKNNHHKYRWVLKPWDSSVKDSKRARYVTEFFEFEDRVELCKLELQKESITKFLINNGWTKQAVGLRFERDIYQREI
ncbi:MAG: hypothetical protein FWH07_00610 [Oscillospiraceae bacterium]|nr:hypothetical protein [Oscillospiraceae bacterium]